MPHSEPGVPLAVVYDRADATRLIARAPAYSAVLALSPAARATLAAQGVAARTLTEALDDTALAEVVEQAARLHDRLTLRTRAMAGLAAAAAATLTHAIHLHVTLALTLDQVLNHPGPWLIPQGDDFVAVDEHDRAVRLMMAHMQAGDALANGVLRHHPWQAPARWMAWLAARLAGRRHLLILGKRYGLGHMVEQARRRDMPVLALRAATTSPTRALAAALRGLAQALSGRPWVELVAPPPRPDPTLIHSLVEAARTEAGSWLDGIIGRQLEQAARQAALAQALVPSFAAILKSHHRATTVLHSARWLDEAALAEASGHAGLRRVLISHGSHAWPQSGPALAEHQINADGLLTSALADECVVQSPLAEAFALNTAPQARLRRFRPILWGYKTPPAPKGGEKRRILHAGTFKPLTSLRPWIYESADEYVAGLVTLVRAMEQIPDAKLAIRLRPGRECDADALIRLLPDNGCWELSRVPAFLDDLAASDLLVSYASTTIEEALQVGVPVLLWGGSPRYRHVTARTESPIPGDRAAVYATVADNLATMLDSILACHREQPLGPQELESYCWPAATPGTDEFLAEIKRAC